MSLFHHILSMVLTLSGHLERQEEVDASFNLTMFTRKVFTQEVTIIYYLNTIAWRVMPSIGFSRHMHKVRHHSEKELFLNSSSSLSVRNKTTRGDFNRDFMANMFLKGWLSEHTWPRVSSWLTATCSVRVAGARSCTADRGLECVVFFS